MMERLGDLLKERSIPLTVAVFPWPSQILTRDRDSRHVRFWEQWCHDHDAKFVDLHTPFFDAGEAMEVLEAYYIPLDCHWNAEDHQLIADLFSSHWRKSTTGDETTKDQGRPPEPEHD